jgi:S1-C subfamily serine protease
VYVVVVVLTAIFYILSSGAGIADAGDAPARPTFGMSARDMDEAETSAAGLPFRTGIIIFEIKKGSVAEKVNLQLDDIIFECNGKPVACGEEMMRTQIAPNGKNVLKVYRGGKQLTVEVDFSPPKTSVQ